MSSTYRCSCGGILGPIADPWVCENGHVFLLTRASDDHAVVTAFDEFGRKRHFSPETVTGRRMKAIQPVTVPPATPGLQAPVSPPS